MDTKDHSISIETLSGSRKDRRRFVMFQFDLYCSAPLWIPPVIADEVQSLDAESNPGLEGCEVRLWLALRHGRCVGRVAGVINHRDNDLRRIKAARFCLLEFIDDPEVSKALLDTVEDWAVEQGMLLLEGPLGLTTFERSAVLIEGFDRLPTVVSSYNFPYYADHLVSCGYAKHVDYLEHRFPVPTELDPKYGKVAEYILKKKGLRTLDHLPKQKLRPFGQEIFQLINNAYADLFEFTPMSHAEVETLITKFFRLIDTRFVKLVVDHEDTIIAVGIAMPSYSHLLQSLRGRQWRLPIAAFRRQLKGSRDTLDLYLVAVAPEHQNSGLHAILMQMMHRSALDAGFQWIETNGELETNTQVLSMWKDIDHETHKRRRIYCKKLESSS